MTISNRIPVTQLLQAVFYSALIGIAGCFDDSDNSQAPEQYEVSTFNTVFVDPDRGTPATGEFPALPDRTLETTVLIPEGNGRFPLLIFSHGLGSSPLAYESLLTDIAAKGFVVVAPLYPLTGENAPAGADPADTQNQPGDVSFLIDAVSAAIVSGQAPFDERIDIANIGTFGHSNGGITTLGVTANSCCRDPRIDAAASLSAAPAPYNGGDYDFDQAAPLLLIHGTVDLLIPYEESARVFNALSAAKGLLTMEDVGHTAFLMPSGQGYASTANSLIDFFSTHLRQDAEAETRLAAGEVYDTAVELIYSASGGADVTVDLPPPITNRLASVEPASNLSDGQVVSVSWRNFVAGNVINIVQCSQGGTGGNEVCGFSNALILRPNPTGAGSLAMTIVAGEVGSGRCDASTDDCVIVVNDGGLTAAEATIRIPISFAP